MSENGTNSWPEQDAVFKWINEVDLEQIDNRDLIALADACSEFRIEIQQENEQLRKRIKELEKVEAQDDNISAVE
jgi:hypothetical protein